jgi:hypothetical protein
MTKYYTQTDYPNIYKSTYWGAFKNDVKEEIIYNRNRFISDFNIQCYNNRYMSSLENILRESRNKLGRHLIDHVEHYKTYRNKSGFFYYVIVISPYGVSERQEKNLLDDGWNKMYKIYTLNSHSYYKMIKSKSRPISFN